MTQMAALAGDRAPGGNASEIELARALEAREVAAHAEAFNRHSGQVAMAAAAALGSRSHVDEVVQEVFTTLWAHPDRYCPLRGTLASYLRMQARSRSLEWARSETRRQRRDMGALEAEAAPGVEEQVMSRLDLPQISAALAELPSRERTPIELAFFAGLSYRAVATKLGESEGTVKTRIRSGLRRLAADARLAV